MLQWNESHHLFGLLFLGPKPWSSESSGPFHTFSTLVHEMQGMIEARPRALELCIKKGEVGVVGGLELVFASCFAVRKKETSSNTPPFGGSKIPQVKPRWDRRMSKLVEEDPPA